MGKKIMNPQALIGIISSVIGIVAGLISIFTFISGRSSLRSPSSSYSSPTPYPFPTPRRNTSIVISASVGIIGIVVLIFGIFISINSLLFRLFSNPQYSSSPQQTLDAMCGDLKFASGPKDGVDP